MIISRTPLRISFAGGGSDLAEYYRVRPGFVVSSAIDKYVYITVNEKFDHYIRVSYSKTELVEHVDQLDHNIIREAMKITGVDRSVDIVYMADLPSRTAGTGLGSSSALAVGVLNALHAYQGRHVTAEQLGREACQIEIETLKQPIGKQDQYIAAYGGMKSIQFNADDSVFVDPVICSRETRRELEQRLMLFFTGLDRVSSDVLTEQRQKTPTNVGTLDTMVGLAHEMRKALIENDLTGFGRILHEGWLLKKRLASNISNSKIDDYYQRAMDAGALGGKITGAGGGGFLLLCCQPAKQSAVRAALSELREMDFEFEPQGSKIIYVHE